MKNFTISFSKLMMVSIILLLLPTFTQAQSHFGTVNGSALNDTWTLYLTDINMDDVNAAEGDELGIFDGNTLVGVYEFTGEEGFGVGFDNYSISVTTFSVLNSGEGYTTENDVTFKFWDADGDDGEGMEYTGVFTDNEVYSDFDVNDEYDADDDPNGVGEDNPQFPPGENPFSFIDLSFTSGHSIEGSISVDGCDGSPLDATVYAYSGGVLKGTDTPVYDDENEIYLYSINGLANGIYTIEATLENYNDYVSGVDNITIADADVTQNISLNDPHTGEITGTITDEGTDDGIAGVTVKLFTDEGDQFGDDIATIVDGIYTISDVCIGDYYIVVSHDDYTDETGEEFSIENEDELVKDFALAPLPGSVAGTITTDAGATPLASMIVKATDYSPNLNDEPGVLIFSTGTDANGDYLAENIPVGSFYILAYGGEYGADSIEVTMTANGELIDKDIDLDPVPGIIEGTVRDAGTSQLLTGVKVWVDINGNGNEDNDPVAPEIDEVKLTNAAGFYQFEDVPVGTYEVEFTKANYAGETVEDVDVTSWTATTVNANLEANPGSIVVTVKDEDDNAIQGATVTIESTSITTDNSGVATFADMAVGSYTVYVEASSYYDETIEDVQVLVGVAQTDVSVELMGHKFDEVSGNTTMPLWTIYLQTVTLDGENIEAGDEIAIFDGVTMVGVYYVSATLTAGNATSQDLTAYSKLSDGSDGYQEGNAYSFSLYDRSTDTEVFLPDVTLNDPGSSGAFVGDVFPSGISPFSFATLEFRSEETQTFNLTSGYQMISTRILKDNMDLDAILTYNDPNNTGGMVNKGNLDFFKAEDGQQYKEIGATWVNNIGDWEITEGFLVKMNADESFYIQGTPVDPQTDIPLNNGYSIVSYLHDSPMNVATAFAGVQDNLIFVRNSAGKHYWKIGGAWVNNIGNLNPGEGYFVKTSAVDTLIYPAAAKSETIVLDNDSPTFFAISNGDATEPVYTIYVQSEELQAGDEIAAYNGDILVGATVIEDPTDASANDLNIFSVLNEDQGYVAGNEVTFKVWSPRTNEVYTNVAIDYLNPHGDAYTENTYPEGEENYSIVKASVNELDVEELEIASVNIYPNPATDQLRIQSKTDISEIRVINAIGQTLLVKQIDTNDYILNVSNMESGFYILQITSEDRQSSLRFNVK